MEQGAALVTISSTEENDVVKELCSARPVVGYSHKYNHIQYSVCVIGLRKVNIGHIASDTADFHGI